ncbi:MAG: hypothetical protein ABEH83_10470 [Halobacterium sp.]
MTDSTGVTADTDANATVETDASATVGTDADADADGENGDGGDGSRLAWLGLGGVLSLCCVFATSTGTAVVGGTAAGSTAAAGGGPVQIAVAAVTVAALWLVFRLRAERSADS